MKQYTAEITVEFVSLPVEQEKAYWVALESIARLMKRYAFDDLLETVPPQTEGRGLEKDNG
jgi:hypothetical protein